MEEISFITTPIFGVIVGGIITLATTLIAQWFTLKKEERLFDKEQEARKTEWERNQKRTEKDRILDIYKNAISALTFFTSSDFQTNRSILEENKILTAEQKEKREEIIKDVIDWVSILVLRHPDDGDLNSELDLFSVSPSIGANTLRKKLIELVEREDNFFLSEPLKKNLNNNLDKEKPYSITINVDDEHRKKQLIDNGEVIKPINKFSAKISDFTKSQRRKLLEYGISKDTVLPYLLPLTVPEYVKSSQKISFRNKPWQAKLNPSSSNIGDIMSAWEKDFDQALKIANEQKEKDSK